MSALLTWPGRQTVATSCLISPGSRLIELTSGFQVTVCAAAPATNSDAQAVARTSKRSGSMVSVPGVDAARREPAQALPDGEAAV